MTRHRATPEQAYMAMAEAYLAQDLEAAVGARDFRTEAAWMLRDLQQVQDPPAERVAQAARMLEQAFRGELATVGFPDPARTRRRLVETRVIGPDLVAFVEEVIFPDGEVARETSHAGRSAEGWAMVQLYTGGE